MRGVHGRDIGGGASNTLQSHVVGTWGRTPSSTSNKNNKHDKRTKKKTCKDTVPNVKEETHKRGGTRNNDHTYFYD